MLCHMPCHLSLPSSRVTQVGALYGDQTGPLRASTLAAFDRGALCCLVTSDAFALGLDYRDVDVVVNLEALAPTAALYVAR